MKKSLFIVPLAIIGIIMLVAISCEKDPEEICESFDAECGAPELATVCCTDDICYFTYQGKRYDCEDEECSDGMEELLQDMCGVALAVDKKNMQVRLQELTHRLREEARKLSKSN